MSSPRRLRTARDVVIVLVVLDLLALFAFSVRSSTTTARTVTPLAVTPAPVATTAPTPASAPLVPGPPVAVVLPPAVTATSPVASTPPRAGGPTPSTPQPPSAPSTPTTDPRITATCPIPLKEPAKSGGLQSLIDFAPAFGEFSAEAFAAAAAYQPALQLLGPIVAQYPSLAPKVAPVLGPLLEQWEGLLDTVYKLIAPYYAPHRTKVLEAEAKLADLLAPYARTLVDSPLGACVVDLEAALVNDTK